MDRNKELVIFRPHHFLCAYNFKGKGYSAPFIRNFKQIVTHLNETPIEIVAHTDSICAPCPHRRGKLCEKQEKIASLDQRHAEAFGLYPGETLSWKEAIERIRRVISVDMFHHICDGCSWKEAGICEEGVKELREVLSKEKS